MSVQDADSDFALAPAIGTPAPWFVTTTDANPQYRFHTVAGRWILLAFLGATRTAAASQFLESIAKRRDLFDDDKACFFGVGVDPAEEAALVTRLPGVRFFRDYDRTVSRLYGASRSRDDAYRPYALLLDRTLRVVDVKPLREAHLLLDTLAARLGPDADPPSVDHAPILIAPRIFEPELCARLVAYYRAGEARASGFMRDVDGRTSRVHDTNFKRRDDVMIDDAQLRADTMTRIHDRLTPLIERAFGWRATRMERYIVARYAADDGGHFNPHRDNTTRGTAHRKFAVTINLNAEDYDGGDLRFPEFGKRTWRAPTGGAVVFSCSLLHEATHVTRGERFAFLPFLYDDAGAALRERNAAFLDLE